MLKQFYEKVLPTQGVYCASGITKEGQITTRYAETLDSLIDIVKGLKQKNLNVYVTPGSYNGFSRKGANCVYVKSFFIDLDVGEKKDYDSQQSALSALDKFIDIAELPPPIRINSGRGVQAYWVFDTDVPASQWKPYAEKFKAKCIELGLKMDPTVTADAARLMRCPETLNYRTDPPSPTGFFTHELNEYSFDMFADYLGAVKTPSADKSDVQQILATIPKGLDEETIALKKYDNYETLFQIVAEKSLEGVGCAQIAYALMNAKTLGYEPWISALQVAASCDDAETAIHLLSEDHPEYDREKVIKKAATFNAPRTCATYEKDAPERCEGCLHRGKISTPKQLGRHFKEAPPPAEDSEEPIRQVPDTEKVPEFPVDFFRPYTRGVNGGIYYQPPKQKIKGKDGEKDKIITPDPILIINTDMYPIKRMVSPVDGDCLMVRNILPKETAREFILPMSAAYTPDIMTKILTANGVYFEAESAKLVKGYIVKWGQYLQQTQAAEQMRMQFGWTEDFSGFVVGNSEIRKSGEIVRAASSPFNHSTAKMFKKQGDYETWKTAVNKLDYPSLEIHAFIMLCGFGSPLMRFTSTNGAVFSLVGKSGVAKTGAMYAALSLSGSPKELSVFKGTENGLTTRALGMHSLFFGLDEVTNRQAKEISEFIHQMASGKGKIRMQASVNAERPLELSSALITVMTTNEALYDKLLSNKADPAGELARLIEFHMEQPEALKKNPYLGPAIFETLVHNYGFAIYDFIKAVYRLGDEEVLKRINRWKEKFISAYGADATNRFYENSVAATFAGGEIAKENGIIDLDLDRIFKRTVQFMIDIRDSGIKVNDVDYNTILGDFCNQHHSGMLVFNGPKVIAEPRTPLIGRVDIDEAICYVSKTVLKTYLAELHLSTAAFEKSMKDEGMLLYSGKKRLGTGWKAGMNSPAVHVYGFKITPEDFEGYIEKDAV